MAEASYDYGMCYVRGGRDDRAEGRDLWVLEKEGGEWRAVWRTMLELREQELE